MATTLVINPGSSSKKYSLFVDKRNVLDIRFEKTSNGCMQSVERVVGSNECNSVSLEQFTNSFEIAAHLVESFLVEQKLKLSVIAIRIVAPGTFFQTHRLIDDNYLKLLEEKATAEPLHIPTMIEEIKGCLTYFPKNTLVGVSDSAFHKNLPSVANTYGVSQSDAKKYDLYRFGYHGLSVASVIDQLPKVAGQDYRKVVVCHIGSGVSVTAVKAGQSVDTSMGYSPLSGVLMGTRASDLDAGAMLELSRHNPDFKVFAQYLYTQGGLKALAGEADIRSLLNSYAHHDELATAALEHFVYSIQKHIASYTIALDGIEALILTGTAAFRSIELRALLIKGLAPLGVVIDEEKNQQLVSKEGSVEGKSSLVKVFVVRCEEMSQMDKIATSFLD